jgi:anti-sigma regulatory factor (Ser/Thr protein kinase)
MPILARADGTATAIGDVGTPLGIIEHPELPEVTATLGPGDLLVFYTDGVSEADAPRRILTDADLAALVAEKALEGPQAVVEHLARTAVGNADGNPRDDIACLALRVAAPLRVSARFAATPASAHELADALAPLAAELGDRAAMDLRLLATELVANVVRHSGSAVADVEVRVGPRTIELRVTDDGPGFELPERPLATPDGPGGWGLYVVDQSALRWGAERGDRHRVWLEMARDRD